MFSTLKFAGSSELKSIYGRIASIGKRKNFWFLTLRSGSNLDDFPVILNKDLMETPPTLYSTLHIEGTLQSSPDGKKTELHATKVLFYGKFDPEDVELPHLHKVDDEVLRNKTSQRLLTKRYQSILFIYSLIEDALHEVSRDHGLLRVRAPFITFSDCEGGGETFELSCKIPGFFSRRAYLTVSGQVDEETITSRLLCPTYIFGPSFRADPSKTKWHACEFFHYEPEVPFIDLEGLMDLEESILKSLIRKIFASEKLAPYLNAEMQKYGEGKFAHISYTDAIHVLQTIHSTEHPFEVEPVWGIDLSKEHERYLCEKIFQKPTFVFKYPSAIKSFYMLQCEPFQDESISSEPLQVCEGVDLLVPGIGELCGGSTREYRYDILLENMKKKGLDPKDYEEYLSLRKQGTFPHGGFGMGFDRLVMWMLNVDSIRDIAPFPRYYHC